MLKWFADNKDGLVAIAVTGTLVAVFVSYRALSQRISALEGEATSDAEQQRIRKRDQQRRESSGRFHALVEGLSALARLFVAFNAACLSAAVVLVISAYSQLASVTEGICVPSGFVAATIARAQSAGDHFAMSGLYSLIALVVGSNLWARRIEAMWQWWLTLVLQALLLVVAVWTFDARDSLHIAFDRQWFSAEQIQERWADISATRTKADTRSMEQDDHELFAVCLDDEGQPVLRTVQEMTPGEVVAAIDHLTAELAEQHGEAREKLARLLQEIAQQHPSLRGLT
jgi:hypothetical protein